MKKFIQWIMERLYAGVPASWLSNKPSVYRDSTSDTIKEQKKIDVLLKYTVMHILDNNFEADPSELIVIFRNRFPDMPIEEFSMLVFKLGLIVAEFAMDRVTFYDAVQDIEDLPTKYDKVINEMTVQLALEEQAKKHIDSMTEATMQEDEDTLLGLATKTDKISLKSMSTDELHDLLNELIGVIEDRGEHNKSKSESNKLDDKSKEK